MILIIDNADWKNSNLVAELEKYLLHRESFKTMGTIEAEIIQNQSSYLINNPSMTDGIILHEVIKSACFHCEGYYKIRKYGTVCELITITHNKFPRKSTKVHDNFYPQKFEPKANKPAETKAVEHKSELKVEAKNNEPQAPLDITSELATDLQNSIASNIDITPKKVKKLRNVKFEDLIASMTNETTFEIKANPDKVRSLGILNGERVLTIIPKDCKISLKNGEFTTNDETIATLLTEKGFKRND